MGWVCPPEMKISGIIYITFILKIVFFNQRKQEQRKQERKKGEKAKTGEKE